MLCNGKKFREVTYLAENLNKLNEITDTNQKLQTSIYIIDTCLDNLGTRVDGQQPVMGVH